jgi:hypothetical protein
MKTVSGPIYCGEEGLINNEVDFLFNFLLRLGYSSVGQPVV